MQNIEDFSVTKRDGEKVPLEIHKINTVVEWACKDVSGVAASDIIMSANIEFYDGIKTTEIHEILIDSAKRLIKTNINYQHVASKLLVFNLRKNTYGRFEPDSLYDVIKANIKRGVYNPIITRKYTRDEINYLDTQINHANDFNFTHAGTQQIIDKYLVQDRSTKTIFETPQIAFMLIGMYGFRNYKDKELRTKKILELYDSLNRHELNLPTPIIAGLRTPKEQFSSCTVITCGDSLDSISATDDAIFRYTASRAGIGLDIGAIRPIGSKIRSGEVVHTGIIPFLKKFHATNKSCTQNGIRGGAMTVFLPWWHPEIEDFIVIKNDKGSNDARIPGIDPAIQLDSIIIDRAKRGKKVTLIASHYFEGLYDSFGLPEFKAKYEAAEKEVAANPEKYPLCRKINPRDIMEAVAKERTETGRLYVHYIDNANTYSPYKERIRSSNLCCEIEIANSPLNSFDDPDGEIALCTLGAINWTNTTLDRMPIVTDLMVRLLDEILDLQEYPVKAAEKYNKNYRPLGIGVSGFADWMAHNKDKYSFANYDTEILQKVHTWIEAQSYYQIKASVQLAKEKGKMGYYEKTRWSEGYLPIQNKIPAVEELHDFILNCDWDALEADIKEFGVRHVVTGAMMPAESSSVVWNISNGGEPVRDMIVEKPSGSNTITQVAKYAARHSKYYESPWDESWSNKAYLRIMAVMQKFIDQGISLNLYYSPEHTENNKISLQEIIGDIIYGHELGHKAYYYQNTNDMSGDTDADAGDDCAGGGCKL